MGLWGLNILKRPCSFFSSLPSPLNLIKIHRNSFPVWYVKDTRIFIKQERQYRLCYQNPGFRTVVSVERSGFIGWRTWHKDILICHTLYSPNKNLCIAVWSFWLFHLCPRFSSFLEPTQLFSSCKPYFASSPSRLSSDTCLFYLFIFLICVPRI